MNLPKGIINIISDYSHTLFYIEELKDKTKEIYQGLNSNRDYESSYIYGAIKFYGDRCILDYPSGRLRFNLQDKQIKRKYLLKIKPYTGWYSKNYKSY